MVFFSSPLTFWPGLFANSMLENANTFCESRYVMNPPPPLLLHYYASAIIFNVLLVNIKNWFIYSSYSATVTYETFA